MPDILADGAYDEAINGVEYVIHVASPLAVYVSTLMRRSISSRVADVGSRLYIPH